jgi:hypothetical protein
MDIRRMVQGILMMSMLLFGLAVAHDPGTGETGADTIESGLCELYNLVQSILAVVVFILIVVAAVVYAGGQIMGAETRARASVWATSMIVGALIGILIYIVLPIILDQMLPAKHGISEACLGTS